VRIFTFTIFVSGLSSSTTESESPYEGRLSESAAQINDYKISYGKPNVFWQIAI
jgi:hypothetical protein